MKALPSHLPPSAPLVSQRQVGYHDCGADWGWCGEHPTFRATFDCPGCDKSFTVSLCAAWPCSRLDCPHCYAAVNVELSQKRTKAALR